MRINLILNHFPNCRIALQFVLTGLQHKLLCRLPAGSIGEETLAGRSHHPFSLPPHLVVLRDGHMETPRAIREEDGGAPTPCGRGAEGGAAFSGGLQRRKDLLRMLLPTTLRNSGGFAGTTVSARDVDRSMTHGP
jgi:hypothetical protein